MRDLLPGYKTIIGVIIILVVAILEVTGVDVASKNVETFATTVGTVLALLGIRFKAT